MTDHSPPPIMARQLLYSVFRSVCRRLGMRPDVGVRMVKPRKEWEAFERNTCGVDVCEIDGLD